MAIGDVYKLSIVGRFGFGGQWVNTHYYKQIDAVLIGSDEQALVDDWLAQVETQFLGILNTGEILDQLEVRQVLGGINALDHPVGDVGTGGSGEKLPPMDCALISWRTGLIGRANRGRTYFPSPFESFQAGGALTVGAVGQYQDLADVMITLNDATTGLLPRWQKVIWHTSVADSPEVVTGLVRNLIATQRRRRAGVGS